MAAIATTSLVFVTSVLHHSFRVWMPNWFFEASVSALLSALLWQLSSSPTKNNNNDHTADEKTMLLLLAALPWWKYLSRILAKSWPPVILAWLSPQQRATHVLVQGGPLGPSCAKLCDTVAGFLLWYVIIITTHVLYTPHQTTPTTTTSTTTTTRRHHDHYARAPTFCSLAKPDHLSVTVVSALLLFTGLVNVVLHGWSRLITQSPGKKTHHQNLQALVERQQQQSSSSSRSSSSSSSSSSLGRRRLVLREKVVWLLWAFVNAVCEEVSSRGLWRSALAVAMEKQSQRPRAVMTPDPTIVVTHQKSPSVLMGSNLLQALVFGLWHYHGIPSGWMGVCLTFVYGAILGWLADQTGGSLWLPILTHTMADYYIFTILVQPKPQKK